MKRWLRHVRCKHHSFCFNRNLPGVLFLMVSTLQNFVFLDFLSQEDVNVSALIDPHSYPQLRMAFRTALATLDTVLDYCVMLQWLADADYLWGLLSLFIC